MKTRNKKIFFRKLVQLLKTYVLKIIAANREDIQKAEKQGLPSPFVSRLEIREKDIESLITRVKEVGKAEEGEGRVLEEKRLENGVLLRKISVPLGTILVIYESRPEVTIDAAILGVKSGNKVILKGGSEASQTNSVLFGLLQDALIQAGIHRDFVQRIVVTKRKELYDLLQQKDRIDLVIARGGYEMVAQIQKRSKIPVLAHSSGGARIYVDKSADIRMALNIIINAKVSKPVACNSVDTVLVHKEIAKQFIPLLRKRMKQYGVKVKATLDWNTELLDLIMGIKIVADVEEAILFIKTYTKKHTEGVLAKDTKVIETFTQKIDVAAIMVNCSTRLHDGGVFEMGAEMGIATGKLHARGPVGYTDLTTYKWIALGNGQIRE